MLTSADADLVQREAALPGLAMLLDADAFLDVLRAASPRVPLAAARPVYVRYKPATSCLVSYEVATAGAQVPVHATAYTIDRRALLHAPKRPSVPGPIGDGRFVIDELATEICVFPNDHAVRALQRLCDLAARDQMMRKYCPDDPDLWRSCFEPLAYKPGRRCVGLLRGRKGRRAIAKAYTEEGYERANAGAQAFASCSAARIPRVLGDSARDRLRIVEWLPGDPLADLIATNRADAACMRRVGAALAMLHQHADAQFDGCRAATQSDELAAVARGIGVLRPELAGRAQRLAQDIAIKMDELSTDVRPIHGDFYAGQVLIAADAVNVIDFDRAGCGDPRVDVGNFIAHLEYDALAGRIAVKLASSLMDVLIEGYEDAAPHACCRSGIHAFVAAGLLALAPHPFRVRDPEWPERIATILDRAESLVASNAGLRREHSGRSASVPDSSTTLADRALSLSSEALDLAAMERRVSQLPAFDDSRCSLRLSAVRVTRHKPGRRCLIEYDLTVSRDGCPPRAGTLVAKVRWKGADTRTYGLTQTLWRDGFNSDSADGVSVPEPVGLLADLKMWMQWKAPGTLAAQLLEDTRAVAVAERAAAAICKLHNSGASPSRRHGTDDELRILRDRLDAVATETPRWRRRLDALFDASARFANTVPAVTPRGIHRDFHPGQMLVDGERVYLLDLDLYASGDPALDVGNFLAHLAEYSLRTFGDPERLAACEAALTDHFLESTPDISARSIEIYKTLSLARHIYISRLFLERQAFTERILDLCEARLSLVR